MKDAMKKPAKMMPPKAGKTKMRMGAPVAKAARGGMMGKPAMPKPKLPAGGMTRPGFGTGKPMSIAGYSKGGMMKKGK